MELFKKIRLKIGNALLKKKMIRSKNNVCYSGFSQVKSIGIVWDASKTEEFSSLAKFHQRMHDRKIKVKIIGYFPGKNLPDQYTAIRYLTCIRKNETNYFYHPVSSETNTFISNHHDIIIDINFNNHFPLKYITSLSKAGIKVGLFEPGNMNNSINLMLEIKKPVDIDNYLIQTIHYLEMIKDGTLKQSTKT